MPIKKDFSKNKDAVLSLKGTLKRSSSASSFTIKDGGINNFFSDVPVIGFTESTIEMKFGGTFTDRGKITTQSGVDDAWYVNWCNVESNTHEYTAAVAAPLIVATLNNEIWHNYVTGLDVTIPQLGTFATRTATDDLGDTVEEIYFTASNEDDFFIVNPATSNGNTTDYEDVGELVNGGLDYSDNFEPDSAILNEDASTITLTVASTSLMDTNIYWVAGRLFGTSSTGNDVPAWESIVTSNTTSGSTTTIVLKITSGLVYLVAKELSFQASESLDNSVLPIFEENVEKHFIINRNTITFEMNDDIVTDGRDYNFSGTVPQEEYVGDIETSSVTNTYNTMSVNSDSVTSGFGDDVRITGIPQSAVSSTLPTMGTQIRILNFSSSSVSVNTGSGIMFVRVDSAVNTTALEKYTVAAQLLSDYKLNGVDLVCTVSGTDNDPTITFRPRNTTINWTGAAFNAASDWTGSVSTGTASVTTPIYLSLENDPNRVGDKTEVTFQIEGWDATADDAGFLNYAEDTVVDLTKGFKVNTGLGYNDNQDGKNVVINGEGVEIAFSASEKGTLMDSKNLTSGAQTILATEAEPWTMNLKDSLLTFSNFDVDAGANFVTAGRTFIIGSAGGFTRNNHILNLDNVVIGVYNVRGLAILYSTLGKKKDVTLILDTDAGGILNAPSTLTPTLTGIRTVVNCDISFFRDSGNSIGTTNTQALARDFNSLLWRINAQLEGTGVVEGTRLRGYNPQSVNFSYINYLVDGNVYGLDVDIGETIHTWTNRGAGGAGSMQYGVLYNPKYQSEGEDGALTDTFEEIYYNSESETTLVPVKEGAERNAIGTIGEQLHPFVSGVTISDTLGLADARISSAGVNSYSAGDAFIDETDNYSGITLMYARRVVDSTSPSTDSTADENNVVLYAKTYFGRVKRAGHIPSFYHKNFSDDLDTLEPLVLLRKDKYWQALTTAAIDTYATAIEASAHTVSTDSDFKCSLVNAGSWNDNWRKITYNQSTEQILGGKVGDEDRPYDSTNNINGRFLDLIDAENGVTSEGLMDVSRGPWSMSLEFNQTVSTDENAILGLYAGSESITHTHTGGTTKSFKGKLRTTGDIIFATINTNSSIAINDSEIYADDLRITAVASASHLPITNAKIEVNSLTFGGSYASQSENLSANYNIANSEIKVNGDNIFNHDLDNTTISGAHTRTITGEATDLTIIDAATVIMDTNSVDSRLGIISNKVATVTYSSTATPTDDIVHASGAIVLPDTILTGVFNSDTSVTGVDAAIESTTPILTITGTLSGDSKVNNVSDTATLGELDGARLNLTAGADAVITNITDGQVVGVDKTATVTTTNQIVGGTFDTVTFESMPTNTLLTRHSGDYSNVNFEMTNSGAVEFANDATGTGNVITRGPVNTIDGNGYNIIDRFFKINIVNGVENSFEIKSTINFDIGGNPVSALQGVSPHRYHIVGNTVYRQGTFQQDVVNGNITERYYSLIDETKAENAVVRKGGIVNGITIAAENGTNFTENVEFSEDPFTVVITPPDDTFYKVKYGNTTTSVQTGTFSLDEVTSSRGDVIKIGAVRLGYSMVYQPFTIPVDLEENGTYLVSVDSVTVEDLPQDEIIGDLVLNSIVQSGGILTADFANLPQENLIMNQVMTTAMMTATYAEQTVDTILHHSSANWYRSAGIADGQLINPLIVKVTSSTAVSADMKETYPFYDVIGSGDIYDLTDQDEPLGQNTKRPQLTAAAVRAELLNDFKKTSRLVPVN